MYFSKMPKYSHAPCPLILLDDITLREAESCSTDTTLFNIKFLKLKDISKPFQFSEIPRLTCSQLHWNSIFSSR